MGDGNLLGGIAEAVKDIGKGLATEVVKVPVSFATGAASQISGHEMSVKEEEQRQKSLAGVRAKLAQEQADITFSPSPSSENTGIISKQAIQEGFSEKKKKPLFKDLATLQAVTKGETGRNAKG